MKALILLLLSATVMNASTFFQEQDKQKHIATTAAISLVSSYMASYYGMDKHESALIGFTAGMLVGLGKEIYDSRSGGSGFDERDLVANTIGSVLGTTPVLFIYRF